MISLVEKAVLDETAQVLTETANESIPEDNVYSLEEEDPDLNLDDPISEV